MEDIDVMFSQLLDEIDHLAQVSWVSFKVDNANMQMSSRGQFDQLAR